MAIVAASYGTYALVDDRLQRIGALSAASRTTGPAVPGREQAVTVTQFDGATV